MSSRNREPRTPSPDPRPPTRRRECYDLAMDRATSRPPCHRSRQTSRSFRHRAVSVRARPRAGGLRRVPGGRAADEASLEALRRRFDAELRGRSSNIAPTDRVETTPGVDAAQRFEQAIDELVEACDGFLRRAALRASLTPDERREILRGMVLTRATDNRLKTFFTGGEVRYGDAAFQGKGLSLARPGSDLRRGDPAAARRGVHAIVDGETLARRRHRADDPRPRRRAGDAARRRDTCALVLSAQMAKAGPPMDGKDLHVGDLACGILPGGGAAGHRHADDRRHGAGVRARRHRGRVAISFIGEGGSSLGEWHEAINLCAARRLPRSSASRTTRPRSRRRCASSRRCAYSPTRRPATASPGSLSTAPIADEIAAAFAWAAERARDGLGPTLDRARGDADVRSRPPRRHALSREGPAAVVDLPGAARAGLRRSASSTPSGRRAIRSRPTRRGLQDEGLIDG